MDARFRIRTREGRLLEPRTMEAFEELVRSGVVRPEDEVFDALTGIWVSAARHPIVELFRDPMVTDPAAEKLSRRFAPQLPLDLVEAPGASPEEERRAFIEKMTEERRLDPDTPELFEELPLVDGRPAIDLPAAAAPAPEPRRVEPVRNELEIPRVPEARGYPYARPRPLDAGSPRRIGVALLMVVVPLTVVGISAKLARPALGQGDIVVVAGESRSRARRPVPRTEEQIRAQAYIGFLDGVDALRMELGVTEVPRDWLDGHYLSDPAAHTDVRAFWDQYRAWALAARARETELYRQSYLDVSTVAGVVGPVRSLRLAAALEDFSARRGARAEHYERALDLADAALSLDELCRELGGRISYEPIRGGRLSADPVIEAAGADVEAQGRLEVALDRVLAVLRGGERGTPGDRDRIPGWLVEGLRTAE